MSKKSKSEANQTTTSQPITLQDVEGVTFAGNSTGGGAINITDGGAIEGGLKLAGEGFDLAGKLSGKGFDLAGLTVEKAAELTLGLVAAQAQTSREAMDKGLTFAMNAGRSDVATMQDTTQKIMIIVGIVAGAWVLHGWGKQ